MWHEITYSFSNFNGAANQMSNLESVTFNCLHLECLPWDKSPHSLQIQWNIVLPKTINQCWSIKLVLVQWIHLPRSPFTNMRFSTQMTRHTTKISRLMSISHGADMTVLDWCLIEIDPGSLLSGMHGELLHKADHAWDCQLSLSVI